MTFMIYKIGLQLKKYLVLLIIILYHPQKKWLSPILTITDTDPYGHRGHHVNLANIEKCMKVVTDQIYLVKQDGVGSVDHRPSTK